MRESGARADFPRGRVALLTPPSRGAVAVIAAHGPAVAEVVDAHFSAANGRALSDQPAGRIVFGVWSADGGDRATPADSPQAKTGEEVILSPRSDGVVEIHCHGGAAASGRILSLFHAAGCEIVAWQDWPRPAGECTIVAEADAALAEATTRRTAAILLDQRAGALALDVEAAIRSLAAGDEVEAARIVRELVARAPLGLHLTRPWHVAIAGRPNVGKSSLINAIVGYERAIVFHEPGTTRDVLAAETAIDGWPVRMTDSAGLRDAECELEAAGVTLARGQLAAADLVLWVGDATALPTPSADAAIQMAKRELADETATSVSIEAPWLVVANKRDLLPPTGVPVSAADQPQNPAVVFTSATAMAGIDDLLAAIANRLAPAPPPAGEAIPFTTRQVAFLTAARLSLESGDSAAAVTAIQRCLNGC